jgi:CheY-like chemotaxis protein
MKRILVFLGDHLLRENLCEVLRLQGYSVVPAIGIKSLSVIKAVNPDLILSEVKLPWIDGKAVLTSLNNDEAGEHIRFIFLGNKNETADGQALIETGANAFLTMPFTLADLLRTVAMVLELELVEV